MSPYRSITGYAAPSAPMHPYGMPPPQQSFQFADLITLIDVRRKLIQRVALCTIAAAVLIALALPTVWSSSAVVMMDQRKNNVTDISAVLSQLTGDPATLQNQVQILNSRELAQKVIDKLGLTNDPEFNPLLARPGLAQIGGEMVALLNPRNWFDDGAPLVDDQRIHDRVLETFGKHVSADANGLSTAITITVTSRDPVKAAHIANIMAQVYVGEQVDLKKGAAGTTAQWLNQRVQDLGQQLQLQEGAVQSYKAQHGLTDTAPGSSLVDQQLVGINAQLVQAKSDVAEKQATANRINQLVQAGNAADVSSVVSSPLIAQLRGQEAQLLRDEGDLQSKYGPDHPKMQALEQQKRDLSTKITEEVRRIAGTTGNDLMVAQAHLKSLQDSLGGARGELNGENYARVQLQALESNAASTRTQYEAFVARLRQTQDQDDVAVPDSRIISPATVPLNPSAPKRTLMVAASIPLGLLLGLLAALGVEKFGYLWPVKVQVEPRPMPMPAQRPIPSSPPRSAPRSASGPMPTPTPRPVPRPYQTPIPRPTPSPVAQPVPRPAAKPVQRPRVAPAPPRPPAPKPKPAAAAPRQAWNGPPILSEIADIAALNAGDYVLDYPQSPYAERMAALARQLESRPVNGRETGAAVVVITSADGGENKSAIGISLARAAALQGKKALLVDCDPAQSATAAMKASSKHGLYDVLTGAVPLTQAFAKDSRTSAHVLTMSKAPPNLSTMFASPQMKNLMKVLRNGCDLVVIDCAKVGAGPATAQLARHADATILVSRQAGLYSPQLAKSVETLTSAHAAPVGIVVTK